MIEAKITFPELKSQDLQEIKIFSELPKQLLIDETGKEPYIRMCLGGKWVQRSTLLAVIAGG